MTPSNILPSDALTQTWIREVVTAMDNTTYGGGGSQDIGGDLGGREDFDLTKQEFDRQYRTVHRLDLTGSHL